jgi:DNA/RNA-binding domain of Phe-tRNA-synthetase-like protein
MHFGVSEDCVRLGLRAGAVVFRNVRIAAAGPELRAEIAREVASVKARFPTPAEVRSAPEVVAFQELLRQVGVNPRREQPSVERLLSLALKRGDLPAINSLVDAYNLASVRTRCSLGAHDLDRLELPITLRLLTGQESFTPLGATTPVPVTAGEFGYVDGLNRVLCRLDLLQAEFSKVTEQAVNVVLIIEGTEANPPNAQIFAEAIGLVTRYCGGTAEVVARPWG